MHWSFDPRLAFSVQFLGKTCPQTNICIHKCTIDLFIPCISEVVISWRCFWHSYSPECWVVLNPKWIYCTWHNTGTIFHLILQVYRSPSLKEHLHSPVMSLLACNMKRTVSILHAHGRVCACVCDVYVNIHGCVVVCTCELVCAFMCQCPQNGGYKSTGILTCISNHTSTKRHSFSNC